MQVQVRTVLLLILLVVATYSSLAQGAGDAMQFNGTDNIDLGDWSPGIDWTLEAWVNPTTADDAVIVGNIVGDCNHWALVISEGEFGVAYNRSTDPKNCRAILKSGMPANPGIWYHISAINDGNTIQLVVNGDSRGLAPLPAAYGASDIGATIGEGFNGLIDEVRIWNQPRNLDQIRCTMHARPSPAAYASDLHEGIVAYYTFDELSPDNDIITDVSGHDHEGDNNGGHLQMSTAPVGNGTCHSEDIDNPGATDFEDVHVVIELEFEEDLSPFSIVVSEMFAEPAGEQPPGRGIDKYWVISAFGLEGRITAQITYGLEDAFPPELGSVPSAAQLFTRPSTSDGDWTFRGNGASSDPNAQTVTFRDLSGFSQHFITFDDSRLPVELSGFSARVDNDAVVLDWRTASEIDNAGFEVQRARQADSLSAFRSLASYLTTPALAGLGTSNQGRSYRYSDPTDELLPGETYLYRLVDVTTEGVRTEHPAISVKIDAATTTEAPGSFRINPVVPNPARDEVVVSFDLPEAGEVTVEVYASDGRRVAMPINARHFERGHRSELISLDGMLSGSYSVVVTNAAQTRRQQFVIVK